jgi:hypothetical protein
MDKPTLPDWPRLMTLKMAAFYLSVGSRIVEDWVREQILVPIPLPGSAIRSKGGAIVTPAAKRKISKILIDKSDLDALIESRKEGTK